MVSRPVLPPNCRLCAQGVGDLDHDGLSDAFGEVGHTRKGRRLLDRKTFAVFPSLGALEDGHVLVCPKEHRISLASMAEDHSPELLEVISAVTTRLCAAYDRPVLLFEHGNGVETTNPSCSVEHAHLHILPSQASVQILMDEIRRLDGAIEGPLELVLRAAGGREYLLVGSSADRCVLAPGRGFQSQFIRRTYATLTGEPDRWNWREHPNLDRVSRTVEAFRAATDRPDRPQRLLTS